MFLLLIIRTQKVAFISWTQVFKKQSILKVFSSLYLLHFIFFILSSSLYLLHFIFFTFFFFTFFFFTFFFFTLSSSLSSTAMRHKHTPSSNWHLLSILLSNLYRIIRICLDLFEMLFEVKKYSFPSRSLSQTASLSSLEETVEHKVLLSQPIKLVFTG